MKRCVRLAVVAPMVLVTLTTRASLQPPNPSLASSRIGSASDSVLYWDDFSTYPVGLPPAGWTHYGSSYIVPTIEEVGGTGPDYRLLNFPLSPVTYQSSYLIKDGLEFETGSVTTRINFQISRDEAGLVLAYSDSGNHIHVTVNPFWDNMTVWEVVGGELRTVVGTERGSLPIVLYADYWLRVTITPGGPGTGNTLTAYWSTDGSDFTPLLTVPDLANSRGGVGYITWSFVPPHVHFDDFLVAAAGADHPVLDLPIDYAGRESATEREFLSAWQRCVTAVFDHQYPFEKGASGDLVLLPYTGVPIPGASAWECRSGISCYDGHEGYDFDDAEGCGTSALAAAAGVIISSESGCLGAYGCHVVIDHGGGYRTLYGHLRDDETLRTSGPVARGERIGTIGNTGWYTTGTHLHFGVYHNGQVVDPSGWWGTDPDPWEQRAGAVSQSLWQTQILARSTVDGAAGGTATSPAGDVVVTLPAGCHAGVLTLDLAEAPVAEPSARLRSAGHSFSLRAADSQGNPVTTFDEPLTIAATFTPLDLVGIQRGTLALYAWNNAASEWQPLATAVDEAAGTAVAQTSHLSYFALLGDRMYEVYVPAVLSGHH